MDAAGNVGGASVALKYDATPPQATAAASRQPNANGWYKASFNVSFSGATRPPASIRAMPRRATPGQTRPADLKGSCRDRAGNQAATQRSRSSTTKRRRSSQLLRRAPRTRNGWYNAPVSISFTGGDHIGVDACDAAKTYSGPDSSTASISGTCVDKAGNAGAASTPLKYDATAPLTTATPSRAANGNGWRNAPLRRLRGTDATAGIDTCDPAKSYSGPDASSTTLSGACRDKAGNAGAGLLKYDATTGPQAAAAPSRPPNGNSWYKAPLTVSFTATDATSGLASCPAAKTYSGRMTPLRP